MVRCPTEIQLASFLDGALSASEASLIEQHGSTCASCRDRIERATDDALLQDVRRVAGDVEEPAASPDWFDSATGEALERYRVLRRIGAGGMGVVYEAEQKNPRRRVAIKVVKSALLDPELERRFAREVEVLGRLEHPGIARVLEADTFELHGEKRPFFAMELVDGVPLDRYVEERGLGRAARLGLFQSICEALTHAHQKGVLHRDLKPSNILVTADGQPKLLDFGVARSLDAEDARSMQTVSGQLVGTLPFMSPEQVSGDYEAIDTRSDVYQLGLILFRLLSGRLPYDFAGKSAPELVRIVSTVEPLRLRAIDARLPLDLDTIAAKALEKDPARRYASVDALAADVRRFLNDEPIAARPPSGVYQLSKFVRRNKGLVAGLSLAFVALALGFVVSVDQAGRAVRAEKAALEEARTEERVNRFLVNLLGSSDPAGDNRPADYTIRQALMDADSWIESDLADEPQVEAAVRVVVGTLATSRGEHERALVHLERALELRETGFGPDHMKTAGVVNALGVAHYAAGNQDLAEELFERTLAIYDDRVDDPEIASRMGATLVNLGVLYTYAGRHEEAEAALERALALHRETLGEDSAQVARDLRHLAHLRQRQGRPAEVVELLRESVRIHRASERPGSSDAAEATGFLADVLEAAGRWNEAEALWRETLAIKERTEGEEDPTVAHSLGRLSRVLMRQDELDEAEVTGVRAVEILRAHDEATLDLASALHDLGLVRLKAADHEGALEVFYEAADLRAELLGPGDVLTRASEGRVQEAERRAASD